MRFYVGWRENWNIFLRGCENLSLVGCFKIVRLMMIPNGLKWIIYANGGLRLLQMELDPDTGRCARENDGP